MLGSEKEFVVTEAQTHGPGHGAVMIRAECDTTQLFRRPLYPSKDSLAKTCKLLARVRVSLIKCDENRERERVREKLDAYLRSS